MRLPISPEVKEADTAMEMQDMTSNPPVLDARPLPRVLCHPIVHT